jgi:cyclase
LSQGKASAALAASIFHYREYSILDCKKYLRDRNIPVRIIQ